MMVKSFLLLSVLFFVGCSPSGSLVANQREESFYQQFVNSETEEPSQAPARINNLKILETGFEYPIRIALYPDNQFYYQVDALGDGFGTWHVKDGALRLKAARSIFDMDFYVSAENAEGNETVVRFIDRHGYNSYKFAFRNPTNDNLPELRDFTHSDQDI